MTYWGSVTKMQGNSSSLDISRIIEDNLGMVVGGSETYQGID
jgi:hypothetical protein